MDKWLTDIREKISCPQLGDEHYGEWGALNLKQRRAIKRMLDYIDGQEKEIERLTAENILLKQKWIAEIKAEAYKEFAKEVNKELFGEEYQFDKAHRRAVERVLNRLTSKE